VSQKVVTDQARDAKENDKPTTVTIDPSVHVQLKISLKRNRQNHAQTKSRLEEISKQLLVEKKKATSKLENLFHMDGDPQEKAPSVVTEASM
jgi:hypothetical protein